jgi:isopenicillin N synthase-like dioxygenase
LDLGPFLAGDATAEDRLADELRFVCENVGFCAVVNHGVDKELIERAFEVTEQFHALPFEEKMKLEVDSNQRGYIPPKATVITHSEYNENKKLDSVEAFVCATEHAADDPHRIAGKQFYGGNQWPETFPEFRDTATELFTTVTDLGKATLPIWAKALEMPRDFFEPYFDRNYTYCRLAHYPPQPALEDNEFGLGPHADTGFMTYLPQAEVDGLEILDVDGSWFRPEAVPGGMVVNTGQFLERWTNGRFRATPHRVIPPVDRERYSIAVFVNSNFENVVECLPTCTGPDRPPQYPTESYWEFYKWYMYKTYPQYGEVEGES